MESDRTWRRCNACKGPIELGAIHWVCSVSTCNRKRTGMVFCNVDCWEIHLPIANHREAWAIEKTAPNTRESVESAAPSAGSGSRGGKSTPASERAPQRRVVRPDPPASSSNPAQQEVLIVASRLKDYVRERSGMNTSDRVLEPLSKVVRRVCDEAIANARRDGRKTILDRDIP